MNHLTFALNLSGLFPILKKSLPKIGYVYMACFAFKTCKNDAMLKCCRIFRVSVVFNMDTIYFPLFIDTCLKLKVVYIYLYVLRVIFRCRCITYTLTYTIHLFLCIPYYRQMLSEPS